MSKVKILYVEDEPFLAKIVKESLESRSYEVHLVTDGGLALSKFNQVQPDICVFDVMLPNKDGFSIAVEVREKNKEIPIIFLTAKDQTIDVVKGFESGGNDYIRKPFSIEELIVRIQNLLNIHSNKSQLTGRNGEFIKLGEFKFFPTKMLLKHSNLEKQLSYREAEILNMLSTRINETVDRRDILKKVWGDDSYFNSRNLDVYIKKLRNYLSEDVNIQILTLKGIGYRFILG